MNSRIVFCFTPSFQAGFILFFLLLPISLFAKESFYIDLNGEWRVVSQKGSNTPMEKITVPFYMTEFQDMVVEKKFRLDTIPDRIYIHLGGWNRREEIYLNGALLYVGERRFGEMLSLSVPNNSFNLGENIIKVHFQTYLSKHELWKMHLHLKRLSQDLGILGRTFLSSDRTPPILGWNCIPITDKSPLVEDFEKWKVVAQRHLFYISLFLCVLLVLLKLINPGVFRELNSYFLRHRVTTESIKHKKVIDFGMLWGLNLVKWFTLSALLVNVLVYYMVSENMQTLSRILYYEWAFNFFLRFSGSLFFIFIVVGIIIALLNMIKYRVIDFFAKLYDRKNFLVRYQEYSITIFFPIFFILLTYVFFSGFMEISAQKIFFRVVMVFLILFLIYRLVKIFTGFRHIYNLPPAVVILYLWFFEIAPLVIVYGLLD